MEINDHELIALVEANPLLYDKKQSDFKNKSRKAKIWDSIGKQLNSTGPICSKRFGNLRDKFSRELKQQKPASGSGAVACSNWPYFTQLLFLRGHTIQRRQRSNFKPICDSNLPDVPEEVTLELTNTNMEYADMDCIDYSPQSLETSSEQFSSSSVTEMPINIAQQATTSRKRSTSTPKKQANKEKRIDSMCDHFMDTASTFSKIVEASQNRETVSHAFARLAEAHLAAMSPRARSKKIQKLTFYLFEDDDDE